MKIAVVTGSRSEYGILRPVIEALQADPAFTVEVIATGAHLSPEFGMTVNDIEADGIAVGRRIEMLTGSDSGVGMAKAIALGVIGFADALAASRPDAVMLLGDRYEIFAVAQTCVMLGIPIIHLGGGDVTEGAIDDALRHAITKMAHLHFATHAGAVRLIVQLGEDPGRVHCVGNPGLDAIRAAVPSLQDMRAGGDNVGPDDLLCILHPETLGRGEPLDTARQMVAALDTFGPASAVWLVLPNADAHGRELAAFLRHWAAGKDWVHVHASLQRRRFLGLMAHCRAMVGNSSSALTEAPTLGLPAVNIGVRQAGRLAGPSVFHAEAASSAIVAALRHAMAAKGQAFSNPYGDGHTSERIVHVLKQAPPPREWLHKRFHRLPAGGAP